MGDPFAKVKPGDPFNFPSALYNALVEMVLARVRSGGPSEKTRDGTVIRVVNNTGGALDELSVVAMGNPDLTVDATTQEAFLSDPVIQGNTPTSSDSGSFAILLAHAEAGGVVDAIVAGVALVKVDAGDSSKFADLATGVTDSLIAKAGGAAKILWRNTGTGKQWAVVRIGAGAGGIDAYSGGTLVKSQTPYLNVGTTRNTSGILQMVTSTISGTNGVDLVLANVGTAGQIIQKDASGNWIVDHLHCV